MERVSAWRERPALLWLAAAVVGSGTYLLILQSHLTFYADDWNFLIDRRGSGVSVFLDPHNDHIALIPVSIYKTLLAIFGMGSEMPFAVVSTLVFLLSAVLLFIYLSRRLGDWPALLGSILILFLGAGWSDLLWSFQIGFSGSIAAGLGAFLALDRNEPRSDVVACVLLVVATAFSELGVSFAIGALVSVALGRSSWRRRVYVPLVPLVLYGAWYLGWGHTGPNELSFHNVINSPGFAFDMAAQNLASLFGLATPLDGEAGPTVDGLTWGRILLVIAIALVIWRVWRRGAPSRWFWAVLAAGGSFWFLTGFNAVPVQRESTTGRYQYPGAIFVLLIAAEALRGTGFSFRDKRFLVPATAVTIAAAASGAIFLHLGYEQRHDQAEDLQARLGAVDIARDDVSPSFPIAFFPFLARPAGEYFSAVDAWGTPALSESKLGSSDEIQRMAADRQLAAAEGIKLQQFALGAGQDAPVAGGCQVVKGSASNAATTLGPGSYALRTRTRTLPAAGGQQFVTVTAARFADGPNVDLGFAGQQTEAMLDIPQDRSAVPWRLYWTAGSSGTVCRASP